MRCGSYERPGTSDPPSPQDPRSRGRESLLDCWPDNPYWWRLRPPGSLDEETFLGAGAVCVARAIIAERESLYLRLLETLGQGVGAEMNRFIEDDHLRWLSLDGEPAADELRVFLIGNSAALFCASPRAEPRW